ncbi:glycine betaine ABC transporter substrate-binding protein [Coprobacter sp.]
MKTKLFYLILLILAFACKDNKNTIRIATKPMTEQFILGEMLCALIEDNTDYQVNITKGIGGGTSNIHPAIVKGEFDLYPEYTGTGWLVVLKKDSFPSSENLYNELQKEYLEKYGLRWIAPYGFNNAYSLAVNKQIADKYKLHKFSDISKYPNRFILGAEYDFFEIPKGYKELCNHYNLKFKKTIDMDIGLKYEAIQSGKIDVMNIFTTDGQLSRSGLVTLEDDKQFFPTYYCATVVREDCLKKHPQLENILKKMDHILTNQEMSELNYQVEIAGKPEREVAREFLQKKGLLTQN